MLIYEKVVDSVRRLFGTLGSIPSADDSPIIYKNGDNTEIDPPSLNDTYLDDGHGGIIRKSDNEEIKVFIDTTQIIPPKSSGGGEGTEPIVGTAVVGQAVVGQ